MAIHGLPRGGAEKFFVRLAQALSSRHEVVCYIPCFASADPAQAAALQGIEVASVPAFGHFGYKVFYKLNLMLPQLAIERRLHDHMLRRLHTLHRFDVVNTHLMEATRQSCSAFRDQPLPIIESDHGNYAALPTGKTEGNAIVFERLDALACPSTVNAEHSMRFPWHPGFQRFMIPYGYERPEAKPPPRKDSTFTFGLVARGVAEKGWNEAVEAARLAQARLQQPLRLVLVGDGPCVNELRGTTTEPWIVFAGHQDRPEEFVRQFDAGLLPSYLPQESLPNSIIEYLAAGKPVIATPVGGIPEMIGEAGLLVERAADGKASVPALAEAMVRLVSDSALYQQLVQHTTAAASRFDMGTCVRSYESAFASLLAA